MDTPIGRTEDWEDSALEEDIRIQSMTFSMEQLAHEFNKATPLLRLTTTLILHPIFDFNLPQIVTKKRSVDCRITTEQVGKH